MTKSNDSASTEHSGHQHHDHGNEERGVEYWQEFYAQGNPWSGQPNTLLMIALDDEKPPKNQKALDIGCGTGADAIWLAQQGWEVLGIDISQTALDIATEHATQAGVASSLQWQQFDFSETLPTGPWNLITMGYIHLPDTRVHDDLLQRAVAQLAPDGQLIVMGHENHTEADVMRRTLDQTVAAFSELPVSVELRERQQLPSHKNPGIVRDDYVVRVRKNRSSHESARIS